MPKFRLIAGTYESGGRVYNHRKQGANVVESDQNLAALHPGKFERIEEWQAYEDRPADAPQPNRTSPQPDQPKAAPAGQPSAPKGKGLEERYGGNLDALSPQELKEIAEAEDVPLPKGAAKKEELLKALRASGK